MGPSNDQRYTRLRSRKKIGSDRTGAGENAQCHMVFRNPMWGQGFRPASGLPAGVLSRRPTQFEPHLSWTTPSGSSAAPLKHQSREMRLSGALRSVRRTRLIGASPSVSPRFAGRRPIVTAQKRWPHKSYLALGETACSTLIHWRLPALWRPLACALILLQRLKPRIPV